LVSGQHGGCRVPVFPAFSGRQLKTCSHYALLTSPTTSPPGKNTPPLGHSCRYLQYPKDSLPEMVGKREKKKKNKGRSRTLWWACLLAIITSSVGHKTNHASLWSPYLHCPLRNFIFLYAALLPQIRHGI